MMEKGRVAGAKLKPDLVWLQRNSGVDWRKVVVDVKITSTDKMNEAFKEKGDKYRDWATRETREKKVAMAVMVPVIISRDGAVHMDTVRRWKNFAPDIRVDWVWMAQSVLRYTENFKIYRVCLKIYRGPEHNSLKQLSAVTTTKKTSKTS